MTLPRLVTIYEEGEKIRTRPKRKECVQEDDPAKGNKKCNVFQRPCNSKKGGGQEEEKFKIIKKSNLFPSFYDS